MAVCAAFFIAAGIGIAALLRSGRPLPRHQFIFEIIANLSRSEVEEERTSSLRTGAAA